MELTLKLWPVILRFCFLRKSHWNRIVLISFHFMNNKRSLHWMFVKRSDKKTGNKLIDFCSTIGKQVEPRYRIIRQHNRFKCPDFIDEGKGTNE